MAGLVEEAVHRAATALQDARPGAAPGRWWRPTTRSTDLENDVQEECLKILALHQPVAGDLRRVSIDPAHLHRPRTDGRPRRRRRRAGVAPVRPAAAGRPGPLRPDGRADDRAWSAGASTPSSTGTPAAARAVIRMDDEVDRDNDAIITELMAGMQARAGPGRTRAVAVQRGPQPGADRRPGHEHRRGRDLPRRRGGRPPPPGPPRPHPARLTPGRCNRPPSEPRPSGSDRQTPPDGRGSDGDESPPSV